MALEVKKLEVLQFEFQKEMQVLEEHLPVDSISVDEVLMQLIAEIKTVDSQIVNDILIIVSQIYKFFQFINVSTFAG